MRFDFPFIDVLVIPTGATTGVRIVIDGVNGTITGFDANNNVVFELTGDSADFGNQLATHIHFDSVNGNIELYDSNNVLVGLISPDLWYIGQLGTSQIQISPSGGLRVFDINGDLVSITDEMGHQMIDPVSGQVGAIMHSDGITVTDIATGDTISTGAGAASSASVPKLNQDVQLTPGTTTDTPSVTQYSATDIEVRWAADFDPTAGFGSSTWTSPASYTEREDHDNDTANTSIACTMATRQPAVSNAVRTFTNTLSGWDFGIGTTVVARADPSATPAYRDSTISSSEITPPTGSGSSSSTVTKPAGTAVGDLLLAFLSVGTAGNYNTYSVTFTGGTGGWTFLGSIFGTNVSPASLGTFVWYRIADGTEPASFTTAINWTGAISSNTVFNRVRSVVALSGTDVGGATDLSLVFSGDAFISRSASGIINVTDDLQVAGDSVSRGIIAQQTLTSDSSTFTGDSTTDMALNNVPVIAGRTYEISINGLALTTAATGRWQFNLQVNGTYNQTFSEIVNATAAANVYSINGTVYWTAPTTQATDDFTVQADERAGTMDVTLVGGTSAVSPSRFFTIKDVGI